MKTLVLVAALVAVAAAASWLPPESEVQRQWASFKAEYAKEYGSAVEELHRYKIFKERLAWIAKHNARYARGELSYEVGLNQNADLHSFEITERLNRARSEEKRVNGKVFRASRLSTLSRVSEELDWRSLGYVTAVRDQGQVCGSCWAFSSSGALEAQLRKKTGRLVPLSVQSLIDCASERSGCGGGWVDDAFLFVQNNGIVPEEEYPYAETKSECRHNATASVGFVKGFVDVNHTEEDLKAAVTSVGPVSVNIDASKDSFQFYKGGIHFNPECSSSDLHHAVLVVGYGQDSPSEQYWIVKNSWGVYFGDKGYIKMARNKNNNCGIASRASFPVV